MIEGIELEYFARSTANLEPGDQVAFLPFSANSFFLQGIDHSYLLGHLHPGFYVESRVDHFSLGHMNEHIA